MSRTGEAGMRPASAESGCRTGFGRSIRAEGSGNHFAGLTGCVRSLDLARCCEKLHRAGAFLYHQGCGGEVPADALVVLRRAVDRSHEFVRSHETLDQFLAVKSAYDVVTRLWKELAL
jgi:hypothetical protein